MWLSPHKPTHPRVRPQSRSASPHAGKARRHGKPVRRQSAVVLSSGVAFTTRHDLEFLAITRDERCLATCFAAAMQSKKLHPQCELRKGPARRPADHGLSPQRFRRTPTPDAMRRRRESHATTWRSAKETSSSQLLRTRGNGSVTVPLCPPLEKLPRSDRSSRRGTCPAIPPPRTPPQPRPAPSASTLCSRPLRNLL